MDSTGLLVDLPWLPIVSFTWRKTAQLATRCRRSWTRVEMDKGQLQWVGNSNLVSPSKNQYSVSFVVTSSFAFYLDTESIDYELEKNGSRFHAYPHWNFSFSVNIAQSLKIYQEDKALVLHIFCLFKVHAKSLENVLTYIGYGQVPSFFS